jgi:hypothetical protein
VEQWPRGLVIEVGSVPRGVVKAIMVHRHLRSLDLPRDGSGGHALVHAVAARIGGSQHGVTGPNQRGGRCPPLGGKEHEADRLTSLAQKKGPTHVGPCGKERRGNLR